MEDIQNRRRVPRYSCTGTVEIYRDGKRCGWGTVSEIGRGGCYIETGQPLPVGTAVQLRLAMGSAVLEITARVVWNTPQVGMGMHFEAASTEIENSVMQILRLVTDDAGLPSSPEASPEEFLLPQCADPEGDASGLDEMCPPISPEAASGILARIVERINQTGVLTEQELIEIVKAGQ
jgi:hypothetical protein